MVSPDRRSSKVLASSSGTGIDVDAHPDRPLDDLERHLHHVEVAQAEEVHLQQPELADAVHLVLRDDRRFLDRGARFGLALDREVVGDRVARDDDGRRVDAVLAAQPFEAACHLDDATRVGVDRAQLAQIGGHLVAVGVLRVFFEAGPQRRVASHHEGRHQLRDLVAEAVGVSEHARGVAHRGSRLDRREGDDLRDTVGAVSLRRVLDHLAAVARVEVHVDVGHLLAARVEEPFEEQVVLDRVDVDDAQAVGDARTRRAPPARDRPGCCATSRSARGPRRRGSTPRSPWS